MLSVSDADLVRWLGQFFWPFLRILALFAAAPAFSSVAIPVRAKVALAVAVTVAVAGTVKETAPLDLSWTTAVLAVEQVLIGVVIGFAMQLTLAAMGLAGEFVGMQMGFGFASLFDIQSGFQVPVMGNFFNLVALLLFVALNGHLVLLGVLVKSFTIVPIAAGSGIGVDGWRSLARAGALLFQMGFWLALPVVAVLLVTHLAVGFVSRVAPQFNVMSVGFSLFMWVGIAAVIALVPFFVPAVEHIIESGLALIGAALRGEAPP
ncbi:MAG TPA: flagellar biosynthetic protein FliR [Stellaceae bacterium]|nr:flagellar biosynthetic protein FliR [Stellaceae bacterium]